MAVTVHLGTTFVVSDDLGDFAPGGDEGLFHLDTRFLSRHQLRIDGRTPVLLQPAVPRPDGLRDHAARLADGLLAALSQFPRAQPPELFCGYPAGEYGLPVRYPTACRPQAWAAGAVVLLARAILGLEVNALERRVSVDPLRLPGLTRLTVHDVPAGGARLTVAVQFQDGKASVQVEGLPRGFTRVTPRG